MTEQREDSGSSATEQLPLYANREGSFISFNERVLDLAVDESIPLLEQLRFLCISSSNLDEFFEVRVAGVKQQLAANVASVGADGLSPQQQLNLIDQRVHEFVERQYEVFHQRLIPALAEQGIVFLRRDSWNEQISNWISQYFEDEILPVLSPLALDPAHPFPKLTNKSLNFIITLQGSDAFGRNIQYALLRAPRSLPRVIPLPEEVCGFAHGFVFLSSIVHAEMALLFPGMKPTGVYQFRVTRNSDLYVSDEETASLRGVLEEELLTRNYAQAVRLEVADNCPRKTVRYLLSQFELGEQDIYKVNGPVNLNRLFSIPDLIDRPDLKFKAFTPYSQPRLQSGYNIFEQIQREESMVFHHPYEAYLPVVELVKQAARDPDVLAIKQTLYRTGTNSSFVKYLMEASRSGKDVTVIIELLARFDEEANIHLAKKLTDAGIQVVYGVVGYKTHAKMILVVRREKSKLVRYAHVGTGNYHTKTAKLYTDISLITTNKHVTRDIQKVFMQLTGLGDHGALKKVLQSPFTLHKSLASHIEVEMNNARAGKPAHIMARMNSLVEPNIVQQMYEASCAGVKIDLVIRGICVLKPGIPGLSENIRVFSILGRFLEHSRIFYFLNAEQEPKLYISSADWMPRNFFARVEIAAPIEGELATRVKEECLDAYVSDNLYSWQLHPDGQYHRRQPGADTQGFSAQDWLRDTLGKIG